MGFFFFFFKLSLRQQFGKTQNFTSEARNIHGTQPIEWRHNLQSKWKQDQNVQCNYFTKLGVRIHTHTHHQSQPLRHGDWEDPGLAAAVA